MATGSRAPPRTAIIGTPDVAAARVREYSENGVDRILLGHGNHKDLEAVRLIGREVAPRL